MDCKNTLENFTQGFEPEDFTLVAGDVRISDRSGKEQLRRVVKIVNHEEYDADTISYDIGMLFLDAPFIINESVAPIPLPEQGQDTKGGLGYCALLIVAICYIFSINFLLSFKILFRLTISFWLGGLQLSRSIFRQFNKVRSSHC